MRRRHTSTNRIVCWRFTRRCNRTCPFCLSNSGPHILNPHRDPVHSIRRLKELGVEKVSYSGGEPLLDSRLTRTLREGHELGLLQILVTNGDILSEKCCNWLSLLEYLKLSFYGGQSLHDKIMGSGHYEQLMKTARNLTEHKIVHVGANYMLTMFNMAQLPGFLEDALFYGFRQVLILNYIPTGNPHLGRRYHSVATQELEKLRQQIPLAVAAGFEGGVKIHDYSVRDFYVVLTENDLMTLPREGQEPDFVMGGLFKDQLYVPEGVLLPASEALDRIWRERNRTRAIMPV